MELKFWLKSYNKLKIFPRCWLYTLQSPVLHEKRQSWARWWDTDMSLCNVHACTALELPTSGVGARGKRSQVAASSAHSFLLYCEHGNGTAVPWLAQTLKLRKNLRSSTAQEHFCWIIPLLHCPNVITTAFIETSIPQKICKLILN